MSDIKLNVRVFPVAEPLGNLRAFDSVGVDDLIAIRGLRVIEGEKGLFVTMPQSKDKEGQYHDVAFPLNPELRQQITRDVIDAYSQVAELKPLAESLREGAEKAAAQSVPGRDGAKEIAAAVR